MKTVKTHNVFCGDGDFYKGQKKFEVCQDRKKDVLKVDIKIKMNVNKICSFAH